MTAKLTTEKQIVLIPGGPGLSSDYWNDFAKILQIEVGINTIVYSLLNHDNSYREDLNPSFDDLVENMIQFLRSCNQRNGEFPHVIAHSFGALAACLAISKLSDFDAKLVCLNMPSKFEFSEELKELSRKFRPKSFNSENDFQGYWRQLIPHYFYSNPTERDIQLLTQKTIFMGNQTMSASAPSKLSKFKSTFKQLYIIESANDLVVPGDNLKNLREILCPLESFLIADCGHFPMLEQANKLKSIIKQLLLD